MRKIKKIVDECGISEKRNKLLQNRDVIIHLKHEMSNLSLFKSVSRYAYNLGEIKYLSLDGTFESLMEIERIKGENEVLLENQNVLAYDNIRRQIERLELENSEYYQSINIDLRGRLFEEHLPSIFVYQGTIDNSFKVYRHIIVPGLSIHLKEDEDVIIHPYTEKSSDTYLRHFYNRISFKYLEQLSEDYNYNLDSKNLGRVRILKK